MTLPPTIHMANAKMQELREDGHILISATEREAETLGLPEKRSRKRTLSLESNPTHNISDTHNMSETNISVSDNGNDSSTNVAPESGLCLPAQYSTPAMGSVEAQNFGNLKFDSILTLDANLPVPLQSGNAFTVNINQLGTSPDVNVASTQVDSDLAFQMYSYCK